MISREEPSRIRGQEEDQVHPDPDEVEPRVVVGNVGGSGDDLCGDSQDPRDPVPPQKEIGEKQRNRHPDQAYRGMEDGEHETRSDVECDIAL